MANIREFINIIKDRSINIIKYGFTNLRGLAPFLFDMSKLDNTTIIDWKNWTPKQFGVKITSGLLTDTGYNKITWQEVNTRDQVMKVNATGAGTITLDVVGPITIKRGTSLWNSTRQEAYVVIADASTSTSGPTTLTVNVDTVGSAVANDSIRYSGYSKPYGNNEGNISDPDGIVEVYNYFTGINQEIEFDQEELNASYKYFVDTEEYIKQKVSEAVRKMLVGVQRSVYVSKRGTFNTGGVKNSAQMGGLDWFIRNESGIAGINLAGATGAGMGEINVGNTSNTTAVNKDALYDAITEILASPMPGGKGDAGFVAFCTTPFARTVENLFGTAIVYNDKIGTVDLTVTRIKFAGGEATFIVDDMLDILNQTYGQATPTIKTAYFVPTKFVNLVFKGNDVETKDGRTIPGLGRGKIFVPAQTTEEISKIRLYTTVSMVFGGIKSGAYRKVNLQF